MRFGDDVYQPRNPDDHFDQLDAVWDEKLFRYEVFKMLKVEGKIKDVIIENIMNWRHSRFNVYCGKAI